MNSGKTVGEYPNLTPFPPGVSGNPDGRPKGSLSIKNELKKYLEDHPDEKAKFIGHFAHKNRELAWQMLEGSPNAKTDVTSGGRPLPGIELTDEQYRRLITEAATRINSEKGS